MRFAITTLFICALSLASCGRDPASRIPGTEDHKVEGPSINTLSHEQLMGFYAECTQYGRMDDPKVKYTAHYCSAVNRAQEMEGYSKHTPRPVDPNPLKLH
jgi:hypothetical protein